MSPWEIVGLITAIIFAGIGILIALTILAIILIFAAAALTGIEDVELLSGPCNSDVHSSCQGCNCGCHDEVNA